MKFFIYGLLFIFTLIPGPLAADECMEGDCEEGIGIGFTAEGKIYQGQWKDGLPHGNGKLLISKGKYIEGFWEKGKLVEEKSQEGGQE